MNRFIRLGLPITFVYVIVCGLFLFNIFAQQYTGRGVPVDVSTGLPASTFPIVTDGIVHCVIPDGSGGWFIGGSFTTVGGVSRTAVARINSDGTLNESWNADVGTGGIVYALAIGGTGGTRLYLGGSFSSVGGTSRNNIAGVSIADGSLDTWYLGSGATGTIYAITLSFANNVVLGGDFSYVVGANTYVNLIQINNAGTIATQVGALAPVNGVVRTLAFGSQFTLSVGGDFTSAISWGSPVERNRIARWGWDAGFGAYLLQDWNPNANAPVRSIKYITTEFSPDVIVAGDFTSIGGESRNYIARINWNGEATSWDPDITGTDATVYALSLSSLDATELYVGGNFGAVGLNARNNLAAIDVTSGAATGWNPQPDGVVRSLAATTSYVYVGGEFDYMGAPMPEFSVTPTSINFGTVGVGIEVTDSVVVTNNGAANLEITSVVSSDPAFDVTPTSGTIPPSESETFYITFNPSAPGNYSGEITFTHNAPGSPSDVTVSGDGTDESWLLFTSDYHLRLDNETYTDTLRLIYNGSSGLNGLQFKLRSNPQDVGSVEALVLTEVEKGSDIAGAEWNFFYELKEDGASDYIIVLIYGQDSTTLNPGTYNDLVRFTYETVNVAGVDTIRSHFRLEEVYSSFINGDPAGVLGDDDQVVDVYGVAFYGDINMDGSVDIQDLILVREYILERITFTPEEFERADIAPWLAGNPAPSPDGLVNVQDLALLQNIILTGKYPDGSPAYRPIKTPVINEVFAGGGFDETTVTFYIKENSIEIRTQSSEEIIGMQIEMQNIQAISSDLKISTTLGNAFHYADSQLLRVLLYDRSGKIVLPAGENLIAILPISMEDLKSTDIEKIILINNDLKKIPNINIKVLHESEISVPTEFALYQNYPNPFNPSTTVEFSVPFTEFVTIKVYDMLGREIRTLYAGQAQSGLYKVNWDGLNDAGVQMSSGSYIYRMTAGEFVQSKKMVFLK